MYFLHTVTSTAKSKTSKKLSHMVNVQFSFCVQASNVILVSPFQVALVYGQMNEPPGARARVALTGLTVAEYFRDEEGQDVLLFIDNIFRFTQAGSEVCTPHFLL